MVPDTRKYGNNWMKSTMAIATKLTKNCQINSG